MATQPQQPPQLHLAELTAAQFIDIWKHFDVDGNGYIEGKELENFFSELENARRGAGMVKKMKEFMASFDKNSDGRIEMSELAQILPTEENFLICFREFVGSSSEFMAAWRKYDTDRSGYIESNELKGFLSDLLKKANRNYEDKKLNEYTLQTLQPIRTFLKLFFKDIVHMSVFHHRLLPVQENFLLKFQVRLYLLSCLIHQDGNGCIDEQELDALLKDLCDKNKMDYKKSIMALSDGGKLYRTEMEIVLCRDSML
uniref:Calbindin 2 n=1 Tax=Pundamilia nyererei TaxID=303518 RepID=A0A3B4GCT2_9CICH